MAKQWLHGYQYGPYWVPPLIAPGTFSNLYLALATSDVTKRNAYCAAALAIFSILPITFFFMEPGVNGACKWKVQTLLQDEGFSMPKTPLWMPSSVKHGSTDKSRRWAESTNMKDLIRSWQRVNNFRWAIAGVSMILSGYASLA